MTRHSNMECWQLSGYSSEEEYNKQQNDGSFFFAINQIVNGKQNVNAIDTIKECEKIDNAKEVK